MVGQGQLLYVTYFKHFSSTSITPGKLRPRLERLQCLVAHHVPSGGDTLLFILAAAPKTKSTGLVRKPLSRLKADFMRLGELRSWLCRYIVKRLRRPLETLKAKGVSIWGPMAELLRASYALAWELGSLREKLVLLG